MVDDNEPDEAIDIPPEIPGHQPRTGQEGTAIQPILHAGVPEGSVVRALPEILLQGAREARHSELTWKLISKIAANAEDDKEALRDELAQARRETERWRSKSEQQSNTIVDLRARWDSVSNLGSIQALLYVAGGLLIAPAVQNALDGTWTSQGIMVALLGIAAVVGAFLLGRAGPKKPKEGE